MEELKNCPFCGGKAYLETHHRAFINAKTTKVAFVRCMDCNARSGRVKLGDYGKTSYSIEANKAVTKAWNERVCERTTLQSLPEANPAHFTQGSQEKKGRSERMLIGLYDVDSKGFPNLPLMKISAYHKKKGDNVEFLNFLQHYDIVYISKVFGDEYSKMDMTCINADKIIYGGTGFAITIENGKEVYHKDRDEDLPYEIEHQYPDYSLYPELTKNKAFGFLTRGCCNDCGFCIVSKKEGRCSVKVADLSEWWNGQKEIVLLDPNILACKDAKELLQQLIDSGAKVDFTQGLDARFITPKIAEMLKRVNTKMWHFAFDFMKNEKRIVEGLKTFVDIVNPNRRYCYVYCLTNYDTTFDEDYYRVKKIQEIGLDPDIRIYRKSTAPRITRELQRWCNNRIIYRSQPDFMQYVPKNDGKTIKELYFSK